MSARAAAARVLERCDELATVSAHPARIERVHLSPEHRRANELAGTWMADAGLATWVDAAANRCGRLEGASDGLPALLLGSHLDTVRDAGRYDGTLGVLVAIEVAERMARRDEPLPFALEVVGFADEEGTRFGNALLGSRALAGGFDPAWWRLRDADGVTLREAFSDFGLDPEHLPGAARRPEALVGYLEVHIEQGPYLEEADRALAVVSSIAGARRFELTMTGRAGHAGGTPYERRRDALVGASELVVDIEAIGRARGVIATVGRLEAFPGGINVIPGRVEFTLDLRGEVDVARDDALAEILRRGRDIAAARGLRLEVDEIYRADATPCAPWLRDAVAGGIRRTGDRDPLTLWSRAGHDGMAVHAIADIAMLFVRCGNGGISHHPDEIVALEDVAAAVDALEGAVLAVAERVRARPGRYSGRTSHARQREGMPMVEVPGAGEPFRDRLRTCLHVERWVEEVAGGAPYAGLEALIAAADAAASPLSPAEVDEALAAHPRIGERAAGDGAAQRFSRSEQSSADADDPELAAAIARGNRAYEERFGRIFLIRAAGRSRAEILAELERRLALGDEEELAVVGEQLREIALLRLRTMFADASTPIGAAA